MKQQLLNIKESIRTLFKKTITQPGFKRYLLFAVLATTVMTIATFPYAKVIEQQLKKLEGKKIQSITLSEFYCNPLGSASTERLSIHTIGSAQIEAATTSVTFAPMGILFGKKVDSTIIASDLTYKGKEATLTSSNFELIIDTLLDEESKKPTNGTAALFMKKVTITGLNIQGIDIPEIAFSKISGNFVIDEARVTLKNVIFSGSDLKGKITGSITIGEKASQTKIKLLIDIKEDSELLQKYKMILSSFLNPQTNSIRISIEGTPSKMKHKFIK